MPVTVRFDDGTTQDYPAATQVQPRGEGAILRTPDGKEVAALHEGIAAVTVNGRTMDWPPD